MRDHSYNCRVSPSARSNHARHARCVQPTSAPSVLSKPFISGIRCLSSVFLPPPNIPVQGRNIGASRQEPLISASKMNDLSFTADNGYAILRLNRSTSLKVVAVLLLLVVFSGLSSFYRSKTTGYSVKVSSWVCLVLHSHQENLLMLWQINLINSSIGPFKVVFVVEQHEVRCQWTSTF